MARTRPSRLAVAAALLAAAILAAATPPPAAADELHIRSVAEVRLPLETSISLRLNIRGTAEAGVRSRLAAAIGAFEAGLAASAIGLERGAVKRESSKVQFFNFRDAKCVGGAPAPARRPLSGAAQGTAARPERARP